MKRWNPLQGSAETNYKEMYELFLQDKLTEATKRGQDILKQYPDHVKTQLLLGQIALHKKQWTRARERYNKVLEKDAKLTQARIGRADAAFGEKKYEAALEDYLYLYETSRKTFAHRQKLGATYAALGLDHIALKYYQSAVDLQPSDMDARFALIRHLLKLRQYKNAQTQVTTTKDRYYHHKNEYSPLVFNEITTLENQVFKHLHKRSPKNT